MNDLLAQGAATADRDRRRAIYGEIQTVLAADVPMVNLVEYSYVRPYRATYTGFYWQPPAAGKIGEAMYSMARLA